MDDEIYARVWQVEDEIYRALYTPKNRGDSS